jgi:hypothetical protein
MERRQMSAPREAALSSFAAPSTGNRSKSKSSHVRVVARIRPMNEQEQHGTAALEPIIPEAPPQQHASPPHSSARKGPFKFLTPKRKSKPKNTSTPQRLDDATPVIRNGQRLLDASPAKLSQPEYGTAKSLSAQNKVFDFDAVFAQDATQQEVYERSVGDAVRRNIFRGYNTTIIAYGQTGSGKTYTMGGKRDAELSNIFDLSPTSRSSRGFPEMSSNASLDSPTQDDTTTFALDDNDGIIPRAVHDLFKAKQRHESAGEVTIQLTYLEIYNDELRDLLVDDYGEEPTYMKLSDQGDDGVVVKGLTCVTVKSPQQVKELMNEAAKRRTTASTRMNMRSSRSHAICSLLVTINPATKTMSSQSSVSGTRAEVISAKLTLVDLAGSERIKETGVVGLHQQESININKDLFVLGKVISSLSDKMKSNRTVHVPYRDSKLTRLLRDSLGGNCCTVMVACVSPAGKNLDESVNTLRYAERARTITNAVKQNVVQAIMTPAECAAMRGENKMLKAKVQELVKRVKTLEQKTESLEDISIASGITMDDLSLGASVEVRDDSLKTEFIETEEMATTERATDAQLDAKNLALMSLDLEIAEKKELVEKLRKEAAELESSLTSTAANTEKPATTFREPLRVVHQPGAGMAAPGTKIEMISLSNGVAKNDITEQQVRQHAKEIRVLEDKVQSLIQVNGGLRRELTMQMQRMESIQEETKDNKEQVDALILQLEFEKKRIVEHEANLKTTQTELRKVVEERDAYRMKIAIQADEIARKETEVSTVTNQLDEIGRLRMALSFSEQQVQQLKEAVQEKENERLAQSMTPNIAKGVLTTHDFNVSSARRNAEESPNVVDTKLLSRMGVNPADCDLSLDTTGTGQDSEGSDHKAIRLQAAKMLFFANKAIERGRDQRSVSSSMGSSNGSATRFKPEMSKIRGMFNETGPNSRGPPSVLFPAGKPPTSGKPPLKVASKRSPASKPPCEEDESPVISNIDQIVSMNECLCSKDPEYVDFFLPKLGSACSCGENGGAGNDASLCEGDDPLSLVNILRDWQVDFLHSMDIHTATELVLVYNKMGGVLPTEMRKWRKKKKLKSVKTSSCGVALHIWTRTCRAVIKSVQQQIAEGAKCIKRPAILEVAWTSDNNTAVSSLGSSLAEF